MVSVVGLGLLLGASVVTAHASWCSREPTSTSPRTARSRVGTGQFLLVPGGNRHATESDAKEGALFYMESNGKFDLNPVK